MVTPPQHSSSRRIPLCLPCTRSEAGPVCQLAEHIADYNEVLWHVCLELREEGNGELAIASPPGTDLKCRFQDQPIPPESLAFVVLNNLFVHHSCVVSVQLNYVLARNPVLLSILANRRNVKKLVFWDFPGPPGNALDVLRKLTSPLDDQEADFPKQYNVSVKLPFLPSPRKEERVSLATLDIADLHISGDCAQQFCDMLLQNNTISDLTVAASVFTSDNGDLLDGFLTYLRKDGCALKKLTVNAFRVSARGLQSLVSAIVSANKVEELRVLSEAVFLGLDEEGRAQNCILRELRVTCSSPCVRSSLSDHHELFLADFATTIDPWILWLPENTTLSTLALEFVGLSNEKCCEFFRALALNKGLKNVRIGYLPESADLREICRIIRESRFAKAIHFVDLFLTSRSLCMLPECPEMTSVTIGSRSAGLIRNPFQELAKCRHVSSLRVCAGFRLLMEIQAALAAYITEAHQLKELAVETFVGLRNRRELEEDPVGEELMVNALASNVGLTRIVLQYLGLSLENSRHVADIFQKSQNLIRLSFMAASPDSDDAFVHTLASGINKNYKLLHVDVPMYQCRDAELLAIRNVIIRNSSLIGRASRFVMGDHTAYNARAIELVSWHANVLSTVQKDAAVEAAEAKAMIRRALHLRCLTGLDEYMKLTGVVKNRVECMGRRDETVQLDELGYEAWLHIRKFLIVADVVGAEGSAKP